MSITWVMYKNKNKGEKSIANSSPTYQIYTPTVVKKRKLKSGSPHRKQVVHSWPQTPQGESVAKPKTFMLIIMSLKFWYKGVPTQSVFKNIRGQKHPREQINAETVFHT